MMEVWVGASPALITKVEKRGEERAGNPRLEGRKEKIFFGCVVAVEGDARFPKKKKKGETISSQQKKGGGGGEVTANPKV